MSSLDTIAITIDREGFDALDMRSIDTVLDLAAIAHASPVLAAVFADDAEPAPVRERAFGLLAMQIGSAATSPATPRRLRKRQTGSAESTPCSTSKTRSRRSRAQAPTSAADLRASWPIRFPSFR